MATMKAQILKQTQSKTKNGGRTFGRAPQGRGVVVLHIWAIILVIRMIIQAIRTISPIILYHPTLNVRVVDLTPIVDSSEYAGKHFHVSAYMRAMANINKSGCVYAGAPDLSNTRLSSNY